MELGSAPDWQILPLPFVMKLNVGAGYNFFCLGEADVSEAKRLAEKWRHFDHAWLTSGEVHYEKTKPMLLFEKYLDIHSGDSPEDYKLYCFNGVPLAVLVMEGRYSKEGVDSYFISPTGRYLGRPKGREAMQRPTEISCPPCLAEMKDVASKLSAGFPFVRVDFYVVGGRPVFGEMTFTPKGCVGTAEIDIDGANMGSLIALEGK